MHRKTNIQPNYWPRITIGGIAVFVILYMVAAEYYPGGSNFNPYQQGFSWSSNYWCELLGENAKNGHKNVARPIALTGMVILALSISVFWINLPKMIPMKIWISRILQISGVLAMFCSIFIYSYFHDLAIYLAVTFGTIAFTSTLYGLYTNRFTRYFQICVLCIFLIFMNNFIYVTDFMISYLPILQKFTFILVFAWIIMLSARFSREYRNKIKK